MDVGEFATLRVVAKREAGMLLDWGKPDPLFLPTEEQECEVYIGDDLVVFITLDEVQFPMASMALDDFLEHDPASLKANQKVDLIIIAASRLGFECIIDQKHLGMLYHNEVFQELEYGDHITGYVREIREDGKIDLMTQLRGTRGTPELSQQILRELESRNGFLPVTDKAAPRTIYELFGVSKNKYKNALGKLFKDRRVTLDPDGVRLVRD